MFRTFTFFVVVAGMLAASKVSTIPNLDTGAVFGEVTDENRVPIPGATVRVRNNLTQITQVVRTSPEGTYEVANLRQGRYSLRAEAKDHQQIWLCEFFVQPGERVRRDIVLRMLRPGHELPRPVCPEREAMTKH